MFALLETLIAVYETGQFTIAADELKVSQSTVSSRIAQLERMVGASLFERHAKSDVTPTEAGHLLYAAATSIGSSWRDAQERIALVQAHKERLDLLFSHTAVVTLLPAAVQTVAGSLHRFDVTVRAMNSDAILERIGMKTAHMGVVEKPIVNDAVQRVPLCEDRLVLAGDPRDVWLVREHGSGVRYYTDLYLKTLPAVPDRMMEVGSNAAIVAALARGFGCSVISSSAVPDGVRTRELGPEFVRHFYALTPRTGLTRGQEDCIGAMIAAMSHHSIDNSDIKH